MCTVIIIVVCVQLLCISDVCTASIDVCIASSGVCTVDSGVCTYC